MKSMNTVSKNSQAQAISKSGVNEMADQKIQEVDRSFYDFRDDESRGFYRMKEGLTREIVEQLSEEKHDPDWMCEFRLKSLEIFERTEMPDCFRRT